METLYRIEHRESMDGMWFDYNGNYNGVIETLTDGLSKGLPMPYTKHHKKDNKKWFSGVRTIDDLKNWFSPLDIKELSEKGYTLYKIKCDNVVDIGNELLFTRDGYYIQKELDMDLILKADEMD